jgi:molybdopterin synthase sulfur carrier subunit
MRIRYFAWLRERVGVPREEVETRAPTVAALVEELRARSEAHAHALSDLRSVRAALDGRMVEMDAPLAGAGELALFPPMTGG